MPEIKVYDPPMCCSTGVCGPDADDELAQFAAALDWAKKNGASVDRFNLGQQPGAFARDATVKGLLESDGIECLPLVFLDGDVLSKGRYPTRSVLADKLGIEATAPGPVESTKCSGPKEKVTPNGCCS
jgi:hypothetical protein